MFADAQIPESLATAIAELEQSLLCAPPAADWDAEAFIDEVIPPAPSLESLAAGMAEELELDDGANVTWDTDAFVAGTFDDPSDLGDDEEFELLDGPSVTPGARRAPNFLRARFSRISNTPSGRHGCHRKTVGFAVMKATIPAPSGAQTGVRALQSLSVCPPNAIRLPDFGYRAQEFRVLRLSQWANWAGNVSASGRYCWRFQRARLPCGALARLSH